MSTTIVENQPTTESPKWQQWRETAKEKIGQHSKVAQITALTVLISLFIVVILWTHTSPYKALYGENERYDSAEILEVLSQAKIAHQIDRVTGQILVPENKLADARITLAAHGVSAKLPQGLDILDKATGLGTSQFIESARYRQGLEGELARTILAINVVNHARVHLAIPNRTLFVGINEEKPSAAVMLDLLPGKQLEPTQVEAIVNLVSGSISGMPVEGVSVIDQYGNLLSADLKSGNNGRLSVQNHEMQQRVERDIVRRAGDMLAPLLGVGNFRVQVSATLNFDQVEETHESIDNDPVVRTEFSKQDNTSGQLALGIPGSLSNQAPGAEGDAANESRNERAESTRHYDVGRKVTHTRQAQGSVDHLSVSVLINDATNEQGWQEEQLEQIAQMIKDSVGYMDGRGDQFSLHAFNFAQAPVVVSEPLPWWQEEQTLLLLQYAIYGLLSLSFILFVLRPLVNALKATTESSVNNTTNNSAAALAAQPSGDSLEDQTTADQFGNIGSHIDNEQDLADALLNSVHFGGAGGSDNSIATDLYDLPPSGSNLEVQVEHLQKLTDAESERVADVVKKWVSNNES
ncbi:flagellar M-ring protein FliF [Vibrio sp. ZSDE26]|uniref:Flagellar M-ring protein n=1 Tax=Vibrio amylolyticus TaxID=2847292 RepID=A0A9X1XKH9_9VIBR|nr:flagellar basal-body MS-ring/collar protein FliF [Vibrio amylolyticus]MCK6263368.1 flagellar M-ring protein FliF [Vibrio amylolyticus]